MMRLLLFLALPLAAAVTDLRVAGVTSTAAVLKYTAPTAASCTVEVSEAAGYSPVVNDVNSTLFSGSNADTRAEAVTTGQQRQFVVGKRVTATAASGKRYSRALAANTIHYARVTCGGDTATTTFQTAPLPYGATAPPIYQARPFQDDTSRSETIIDAQTGARIHKLSLPTDTMQTRTALAVGTCTGAGWTNPGNCTLDDGSSATTTGTTKLSVPLNLTSGWIEDASVSGLQFLTIDLKAAISGSPTGSDVNFKACATSQTLAATDTCLTATKTLDLTGCSTITIQGNCSAFGSIDLNDYWGAYRNTGPARSDTPYLLLWKETSSGHTVSVQYVRTATARSGLSNVNPESGSFVLACNPLAATDDIAGKVIRICLIQTGATRQLVSFNETDGLSYTLGSLYISSAQGEGVVGNPSELGFDPQNARRFYVVHNSSQTLYRGEFSAAAGTLSTNYAGAYNTQNPSLTWTVLTTLAGGAIKSRLQTFDARYNAEWISETPGRPVIKGVGVVGSNTHVVMDIFSAQDTIGFTAVYDVTAGAFIASRLSGGDANSKFCRLHGTEQGPWNAASSTNSVLPIGSGRDVFSSGSTWMEGPWRLRVRAVGGGTIGTGATQFEIMEGATSWIDPSPGGVGDATQTLAVGDLYCYENTVTNSCTPGDEAGEITAISAGPPVVITVKRGSDLTTGSQLTGTGLTSAYTDKFAIPEGSYIYAMCANKPLDSTFGYEGGANWNYVTDPFGTSGTFAMIQHRTQSHRTHVFDGTDHIVAADTGEFCTPSAGCYPVQRDTSPYQVISAAPDAAYQSSYQPAFAGVSGGFGFERHPAAQSVTATYPYSFATDVQPLYGATAGSVGAAEAGTSNVYRVTGLSLNRKIAPTFAMSLKTVLTDISSPTTGNTITDATTYSYCVALAANECRTGSSAGYVYVSIPSLAQTSCYGSTNPTTNDVCVGDQGPYLGGPVEFPLAKSSRQGQFQRLWSTAYALPHHQSIFASGKATQTGKYIAVIGGEEVQPMYYMVANPGGQGEYDSVNRQTFVPVPISVVPPIGTHNVIVEFGYSDFGAPANFYCTSRAEACVANSATISESVPFYFASESFSGLSCTSACTPVIPAVPGRVLYYRLKYRNSANAVIQTGDRVAVAVK